LKGGHGERAESIDVLVTATASIRVIGERINDPQHPRHRLYALRRDRGRPCQGARTHRSGA